MCNIQYIVIEKVSTTGKVLLKNTLEQKIVAKHVTYTPPPPPPHKKTHTHTWGKWSTHH